MENESLNNGHIIEVTPDLFDQAANDFSEGNENLRKLLMFCFENGIKTTGCCSGHNGEKRPYIQLKFNEQNMQAILKVLKQLSVGENISNLTFVKQPGVTSNFCISMQNDKYNEGFEEILAAVSTEKEVDLSELDETSQLIVKSVQNHSISNSYLEIQEEKESITVAVGDDYEKVFSAKQETRAWVEETQLGKYEKDSKEVNITLRRLESSTKNHRYLAEHPYDKNKVNAFWKNRDNTRTTVEICPEPTMERKYEYGERNVIVVDAIPGSDIESFANEIMNISQYGQACVTSFNQFEIDTRDYTSADEIVQAYMQECDKKRAQREANKNVTIEDVRDAVQDVRISDINKETQEIKQEVREEQQRVELDSHDVEPEI